VTPFPSDGLPLAMRPAVTDACVKVFNPTDFVVGARTPIGVAASPGATPQEARLDPCGRFVIQQLPETSTRAIMIGVDDCGEMPTTAFLGKYAFTAVGATQQPGQATIALTGVNSTTLALETTQAQALVTAAMARPGHANVYSNGGALILMYRDDLGTPVSGVVPTAPGTSYLNMSNTIYFGADLATLDAARAFGVGTAGSGAVLINPPQVTTHSGMSTMSARTWETLLGGSADGAFFVLRIEEP
jgi:hypothetical protein